MTSYEAEADSGYGNDREKRTGWYQLLASIIAAAVVLALGLVVVGLTTGDNEGPPTNRPAAAESFQR